MSKLFARCRNLAVVTVLATGAAACGGGGGTEPTEVLQPEQVAGDYRFCEFVFTPDGGVPGEVDVLARMDTAGALTRLEIGGNPGLRQFSLLYRMLEPGATTQSVSGTYTTGPQDLQLNLGTAATARRLLLPERLNLEFNTQARSFTSSEGQASYQVNKSDYEILRGQQFPAVRDQFTGQARIRFVHRSSSC